MNHKTAAEVLHGVLGGDDELLQSTRQAILGRANAKRTPSNVTAYKIGDRVRVVGFPCLGARSRGAARGGAAPRRGDVAGSWSWKGAEGIT